MDLQEGCSFENDREDGGEVVVEDEEKMEDGADQGSISVAGATVSENESFCTLNSGESNNESDESQAKQMPGVSPAPEAADTEEADQDSMQAVPSNEIASAVTSGHIAPVASLASPKTTVASPPTSYRTPTQPSIPA